jgi:hypothetical protein
METGAARIRDGLVALDDQREIAFEKLVGDVGEARPQRVAVRAVACPPSAPMAQI